MTLVRSQPNLDAMPQLHGWLQDEQGRSFQLLGMDLFNPGPLRRLFGAAPDNKPTFSSPAPTASGWLPPRPSALAGKQARAAASCWVAVKGRNPAH